MGNLPFGENLADMACKLLRYERGLVPVVSGESVMQDILKLMVMACIQGPCVALLTMIFLPIPRDKFQRESYMERTGYRIKETLVSIISVPLLALASAKIVTWFFLWAETSFSTIGVIISGLVAFVVSLGVSVGWLVMFQVPLLTALTWRVVVTLGYKMVSSLIISALCMTLYVAILRGASQQIIVTVLSMVLTIFALELMLFPLQKAVVSVMVKHFCNTYG